MIDEIIQHKGFGGVTFSIRPHVKYGIRAIPYYQFDGPLDKLEELKKILFKQGIPSSLGNAKLRISGVNNCITFANLFKVDQNWANILKTTFLTGNHRTAEGLLTLHTQFGQRSHITTTRLTEIIEQYKEAQMNIIQKRIIDKPSSIKMLPVFDTLYDRIDIVHTPCQKCQKCGVSIYFSGQYPRSSNTLYLCSICADSL